MKIPDNNQHNKVDDNRRRGNYRALIEWLKQRLRAFPVDFLPGESPRAEARFPQKSRMPKQVSDDGPSGIPHHQIPDGLI
ncbi:MAG: hypothetical protein KJO79_03265 [Verrucomicrobiae bacterium]|nr:hypothetical protein [Verrucomicrobiae bacterium]NNJ86175.1 hypothetical protein [Akkermansiaceae bacterium]